MRRLHWLAIGLSVAVLSVVSSPAAFATADSPTLTLSPTVRPPGTVTYRSTFTATGSGFGPANTTISFSFDGASEGYIKASDTGAFRATLTVPIGTQPGTHIVKALGTPSQAAATAILTVRSNFPQYRGDPIHTGTSPFENTINRSNVSSLNATFTVPGVNNRSSVAVQGGIGYSVGSHLFAFDPNGVKNCSGSGVKTCTPLWQSAESTETNISNPAAGGGFVFVASGNRLLAYKQGDGASCPGTPKTCSASWSGTLSGTGLTPIVAGQNVYIVDSHTVYAFDVSGTGPNCSGFPAVCQPLWTASVGTDSFNQYVGPAVAGDVLYASSYSPGGTLYAFSATGTTNCSGTPTVCSPLWKGKPANPPGVGTGSPAVVKGVVYVGMGNNLYAFQAGTGGSCTGTPKVCRPLFSGTAGGVTSSPAVANSRVYAASEDGYIYVFDAAGVTNCTGTPKVCTALWRDGPQGSIVETSPVVANGVVYIGSSFGSPTNRVYAYSSAKTASCTGSPPVCAPLWTGTTNSATWPQPTIVNGMLYEGDDSGTVTAFGL